MRSRTSFLVAGMALVLVAAVPAIRSHPIQLVDTADSDEARLPVERQLPDLIDVPKLEWPFVSPDLGELTGEECNLEPRTLDDLDLRWLGDFPSKEALEKALDSAVTFLSHSSDPDHQIAASFFKTLDAEQAEQYALISAAFQADHPDSLVFELLFEICMQDTVGHRCDDEALEQRYIASGAGSRQTWALILGNRWRRGDTEGALDALRSANASPATGKWLADRIDMIRRGLAAAGFGSPAQQINFALARAHMLGPAEFAPYQSCKGMAPADGRWFEPCLSYGERLETNGQTADEYQIGLALQRLMFESVGDERRLMEVNKKLEEFQVWVGKNSDRDFDAEFYADAAMLNDYLDELDAHGWRVASERYFQFRDAWYTERCARENAATKLGAQ